MNQQTNELLVNLDSMISMLNSYNSNDNTFLANFGWNNPPFNFKDLIKITSRIRDRIKNLNEEDLNKLDNNLEDITILNDRIQLFYNNQLPQINGNPQIVVSGYLTLVSWINQVIDFILKEETISWARVQEDKLIPGNLRKRLKSLESQIHNLELSKDKLLNDITLIQETSETIESISSDLENISETRKKIETLQTDSAEIVGKMKVYLEDAIKHSSTTEKHSIDTKKYVDLCEKAYHITTTKGLAGAFENRANKLSTSMWVWVIGLIITLGASIYIGATRYQALNAAIEEKIDIKYIWVQIFLSIVSLGAPIWFAWISTKQISQRFKLSEDYAYKASLAKAYEGYKKEAAQIDNELEIRLFNSALMRLDEAPLRLIEGDNHGSPWHEFFTSKEFNNAISNLPDLKNKYLSITRAKTKDNDIEEK